jgi:regulator of sigma E protease
LSQSSPWSVPELGLAYHVAGTVAGVDPAWHGGMNPLQAADVMVAVRLAGELVAVEPQGWPWVFERLQTISNNEVAVQVERNGQVVQLALQPAEDLTWPNEDRGLIFDRDTRLEKPAHFIEAIGRGWQELCESLAQALSNLRGYFTGRIARNLGGPVSVGRVVWRSAATDNCYFIYVLGILSLNFALINLLPIPILDGGEVLLLLIEKLRGRSLASSTRIVAYSLGFALLAAWMLLSILSELIPA